MLTGEEKKKYQREYMKKKRSNTEGLTCPDIVDKLTDPRWRAHLEKVCSAFKASSNPSYSKDVWLGDTNLSTVCDWLECTS